MIYRVMSGRIPAGATRCCGTLPAVLDVQLQEDFDSVYPALLLLFELVEASSVLLTETDEDWYVGAPDPDGHCSAVWLEEH